MPLRTNDIKLWYTLTMKSAFHCGTGLRKGLVHRSVAQDKNGYLYIPGSTFKGSLRNQLYDLHQALDLPSRFSVRDPHRGADDLTEFKPDLEFTRFIFGTRFTPCTLFFDDAHMKDEDRKYFTIENQDAKKEVLKPPSAEMPNSNLQGENKRDKKDLLKQTSSRTQVRLSRLTRTAERDMLFTSEFGLRDLRFEGRIYGRLTGVAVEPPGNHSYSLVMLLTALQALSRLGGNKSTGGGEVCCTVTQLLVDDKATDPKTVLQSLAVLDLYQISREES